MWELIRVNKRKTIVIFVVMGTCLLVLGYFVGYALSPPDGGLVGLAIALITWAVMSAVSYFSGDSILLAASRAREVTHDVHPQLFNIVEEMRIAANLPAMPKIYIIADPAPNAFATGRRPEKSAIAVTAGLLSRLNRDELQGVIAHEMSHILNRDVMYVTFAGILVGSIVLISEVFLRAMWFSGSSRRYRSSRSSKGGGQAQAIIMVAAVVLAILAPIIAHLLYFALSRKREYLADASAARLTRYPEGLASALENISKTDLDLASASKVTAPMYIVNPLKKKGRSLSNLTSTHPPITERIQILRSMAQGVNYASYQEAFARVKGKASPIIPASGLQDTAVVGMRKPSGKKAKKPDAKKQTRDLGDLMRAVNRYAFVACACGLKFKVPPDFKKPTISCPRCGREIEVPLARLAAMAAAVDGATVGEYKAGATTAAPETFTYTRKGDGWESFSCPCGALHQLSPSFSGSVVVCDKCGRKIEIRS